MPVLACSGAAERPKRAKRPPCTLDDYDTEVQCVAPARLFVQCVAPARLMVGINMHCTLINPWQVSQTSLHA